MTAAIAWFEAIGISDAREAGGKGANLGVLRSAGLPVPNGFVVSSTAYRRAMEDAAVSDQLAEEFTAACDHASDTDALADASRRLRELVRKAGMTPALAAEVRSALHRLGRGAVAVRSSAIGEDAAGTSFAGMHDTYANVLGDDAVIERIVDCWASLFGERVISYRASQGLTDEPAIAVVVQEMVPAERAGVMFTADPSTGARDRLVIEGAFGLGEVVVGGEVEPAATRSNRTRTTR